MMRTAAVRPLCAPAASGNCPAGTTARKAPAWAAWKTVLPMPSTKATHGRTQNGTPPTTRPTASPPIAAARNASAAIIRPRRFQRSAARPAGNGEDGDWRSPSKGDDARLDGGVGQRKGQERVGDGRRLRARVGQELTRLEQHEVAVAPEGYGGHLATLSRAARAVPREDRRQGRRRLRCARCGAVPRLRASWTRCPPARSSPSRDRAGRFDCAPSAWPTAARHPLGAERRPTPPPAQSR